MGRRTLIALKLFAAADLNVLTAATGYSDPAIRTATEEMVLAGLIREIEGRPSSPS